MAKLPAYQRFIIIFTVACKSMVRDVAHVSLPLLGALHAATRLFYEFSYKDRDTILRSLSTRMYVTLLSFFV
jgi:hypothetical protein